MRRLGDAPPIPIFGKAQHVCERHVAHDGAEQIRALGTHGDVLAWRIVIAAV
jgi:hypothetical protein